MRISPFHLAIRVNDLAAAREFYGGVLDCSEGRSSDTWVDFNFHGHQLVCHLVAPEEIGIHPSSTSNPVDGHAVPVPHFGVVLKMDQWEELCRKLKSRGVDFIAEPYIRFRGQPGEQATMFLHDPSNNVLEFKAFHDIDSQLFKT